MRTKRLVLLLLAGVTVLWALPKAGEQFNYKVKISAKSDKGKPMSFELLFNQKIKSVSKSDQSYVVEITVKNPQQPMQKQPSTPTTFALKIDKDGKATVLENAQGNPNLPIPPSMLPALAGILPIPSNLTKGKSFSINLQENPKSPIVFKHLGQASYKGKACSKISMTIPSMTFSSSSPQGESKMKLNGTGTFFILPSDNRILQGKLTLYIETKGYVYTPEKKKISLDSKSTTVVEIEKL